MSNYHVSVLFSEILTFLKVQPGKQYIDATLGGGGHTGGILEKGGRVLGIDVDEEAIEHVKENFKFQISNFKLKISRGNFKDIDMIAKEHGIDTVAGIVMDLGVSSHQFDTGERGFSFQYDAPLDMRMDQDLGVKAKDLLNALPKGELNKLFLSLGEERFSWPIATSIVEARQKKPIETTGELETIIKKSVRFTKGDIHPATRVFQALRIAVNDELHVLEEALPKAVTLLEKGGRLAVISFHSLEDRIVKNTFKDLEEKDRGIVVTKKPVVPTDEEVEKNKRSRSAKLRVLEKL